MQLGFSTPVLLIVFNRLDTTRKVFEAIRQAKPMRLYIAADGPRGNKYGDDLKVQAVREYVMGNIDWECEVKTLFREKNLGCKLAVSGAIDWFFENEEEGIILEDDCLPDASFFHFCAQLLEKYRHNERMMMISGSNFFQEDELGGHSYYFSKYTYIWGWASWRRAWRAYDVTMKYWPESRTHRALSEVLSKNEYPYWRARFDDVFSGRMDTWDYQWTFACMRRNGLSIVPSTNLVENIGFGQNSTHTNKVQRNLRIEEMKFPLRHPKQISVNQKADIFVQQNYFKATRRDLVKYIPDLVPIAVLKAKNLLRKIKDGNSYLISRLTRRTLIYVVGDSHTWLYAGRFGFIVRHLGPATMYNLNKQESTTGSNAKLFKVLEQLDSKKDAVLLVFGEIDARVHIYDQYEKSGRKVDPDVLIDKTIANYDQVLKQINAMGIRFFIQGIPPATRQENYYSYQFYAPIEMRRTIYQKFNAHLKQFCEQRDYVYIDVYSHVVDVEGLTKNEYMADEVHLNDQIMPFVRRQLGFIWGRAN